MDGKQMEREKNTHRGEMGRWRKHTEAEREKDRNGDIRS